jgi:hypothetical protein
MGHRLITALIVLNVMGFLACVALIAAAISKDDAVVLAQITHAVFVSVRMFVVGAAVPTVAWGKQPWNLIGVTQRRDRWHRRLCMRYWLSL